MFDIAAMIVLSKEFVAVLFENWMSRIVIQGSKEVMLCVDMPT